jgi:hypothetical protein
MFWRIRQQIRRARARTIMGRKCRAAASARISAAVSGGFWGSELTSSYPKEKRCAEADPVT